MQHPVRAKKHLGQHFLNDLEAAASIVDALTGHHGYKEVLEIGPGTGVLSGFLFNRNEFKVTLLDIDKESVDYLHKTFPEHAGDIRYGDFLREDLSRLFSGEFAVIGNFPYNISSQILFKVLEHREHIPEVVGMFQKEVAERIASGPGNRDYGILSVFMQAYYDTELLFTLPEDAFTPPPKVKSAVLRFIRKENFELGCDRDAFFRTVKAAFNQRRKTLRNALSSLLPKDRMEGLPYLDLRAEALGWKQFTELTNAVSARSN
ncbi:MAG: Ribosomal small subunit methyltransferase [Bacteroidota bacterium]|jgi:16S rRNA (adenine1518-N6/adenine1519-N6)-dimethyltransferase